MPQPTPTTQNTPNNAIVRHKRRLSPFWLLPLVALLTAGWMGYTTLQGHGETVVITFQSAPGLVAGRTPVRFQGVEVGTVSKVSVTPDLKSIEVSVNIQRSMSSALRQGTQFWLVTPKASLAGVSGLDALVGGNYIAMQPGDGAPRQRFIAREEQPSLHPGTDELLLHLRAPDLGALSNGSPVYYRKIPVGSVYNYAIDDGQQGVRIDVLIERRFAPLVKAESRFWNVSGIRGDVSLSGISLQVEGLAALVNGAIAFDSPPASAPVRPGASFTLYPSLASSQRGVSVTLALPGGEGLQANRTPLLYQGVQVGLLTALDLNDEGRVSGTLAVDPSVSDLLRSQSRISLSAPGLTLSRLNLSQLFNGSVLELHPGDGEPLRHFTVLPAAEALLQEPGALRLTLSAPQGYGIDVGQPLRLKGIRVGQVTGRELRDDDVQFEVVIAPPYRHAIHADSRFMVNSRLGLQLGVNGLAVTGAAPQEWLEGGIAILPGQRGKALSHYPLFRDAAAARDDIRGEQPPTTLTLRAAALPDIQPGSPVLYRKFRIGEIAAIAPRRDGFDIALYIQPAYRHLVGGQSVFWAEGGARVQLNGSGLTVEAAPLERALKGAISLDNLSGVTPPAGDRRPLYPNETAARAVGGQIVLSTYDGTRLSPGMPIRYLGIDIGQLASLSLSADRRQVLAQAVLYPEYVDAFARAGTRFSLVTPHISAAGVNNLEALLQPFINLEPGSGNATRRFELQDATLSDARYLDGISIAVDTQDAGSLQIGTPVLYRGMEVGTVTGLTLGSLGDRVQVALRIGRAYQRLVRTNSVFWQASGYNLAFGLTGGVVKTGTFQQFIRGGIAFATPPSTPLAPAAPTGTHFLLHENPPDDWQRWGTAIPLR
ncbi:MCE family protein [Edwardsiella piscicida]|nr:MCE family protein [Edwardsiella piscicida]ELV7534645.1 MCE family protein [Edwardsiella piscicida]